ncbi:MAG: hypothetical protein QF860_08250, partial [Planctomycetota bacterium]|nr:hypothetical protein [Planctomycetota bacterium]
WCFAGSGDAGDPERVVEEARFSKSAARGREAVEDGRLRSLVCVFMNHPGWPAGPPDPARQQRQGGPPAAVPGPSPAYPAAPRRGYALRPWPDPHTPASPSWRP